MYNCTRCGCLTSNESRLCDSCSKYISGLRAEAQYNMVTQSIGLAGLKADKPNLDSINSPAHYTSHPSGIECIQVTRHFPFAVGNVIKYLWREGLKKSNKEDALKAHWYLQDWLMKHHGCTKEELTPKEHK